MKGQGIARLKPAPLLGLVLLGLGASAHAEPLTPVVASPKPQTIEIRLTGESYTLPNGIAPLGVITVHGLLDLTPNWYTGLGLGGSVSGNHGGYFALSLEGGYQHPLLGPLWVDTGLALGGGGGRTTPVGGGFFYEPHLGLSWHTRVVQLGLNYTWVDFTSGNLSSHQWQAVLSVPTTWSTFSPLPSGTAATLDNSDTWLLNRNYLALIGETAWPQAGTRQTNGEVNDGAFSLLGAELGHYWLPHTFLFVRMTGAFSGRSNGYADATLGLGHAFPLDSAEKWQAIAQLGLGSGGGGAVDTGGGFLVNPNVGIEYHLNAPWALSVLAGYLWAPDGDFQSKTATVSLKYTFQNANEAPSGLVLETAHSQLWRIRLLNQTYFSPLAENGEHQPDMQLLQGALDCFVNRYFYLTGQTAFAYVGTKTGGYFSGLVGVGGQLPLSSHWFAFSEALVGTAGGAGLAIGNGALIQPAIGFGYQFTPQWGFEAQVSQLMALHGGFNSTTVSLGLSWAWSTVG